MNPISQQPVAQIALVVDDIERYAGHYAEVFGIETPSWRLTDTKEKTNIRYLGEETDGRAKLAFIRAENLSIELIEPVGGPSVWRTFLEEHGPGVHHIAFRVDDSDATVEQLGLPVEQTGEFKGGGYVYLRGRDALGVDIELLHRRPE